MKKHLKLIVFLASLLIVFLIYQAFQSTSNKINYIALGDSVAEGRNPYGEIGYGYPDYIRDYLEEKEKLNFYTKGFAKSGYTTEDVKRDIENNKTIEVNNKKINIKQALRESDLVTISIGANDFLHELSLTNIDTKLSNLKKTKKEIDSIGRNVEELLKLIQKYAKNEIVLIGYYNPLPRLTSIKSEIDELIQYSNYIYEGICDDLEITCVDVFPLFNGNESLLPNPLDIHPNIKGYELIANEIIQKIEK